MRLGRPHILAACVLLAAAGISVSRWVAGDGDTVESVADGEGVSQVQRLKDLKKYIKGHEGEPIPLSVETGSNPTVRPSGSVIIGWGEEARLVAIPLNRLLRAMADRKPKSLTASVISPLVGTAERGGVTVRGQDVFMIATNHTQFVRLRDWRDPETLTVAPTLHARPQMSYGPFVAWRDSLIVPAQFFGGSATRKTPRTALVEVDPERWTLRRAQIYEDRFGYDSPDACITRDGELGFLTLVDRNGDDEGEELLDIIDPDTLKRQRSVSIPRFAPNMTCAGDEFWIGHQRGGDGIIIGSDGRRLGEFRSDGEGIAQLIYSPKHHRVFGSGGSIREGTVFSCEVATRRCKTSSTIGKGPTDLLVVKDHLFVIAQGSRQIVLLNARNLRLRGRVDFPGTPQGLAYLS